MPLITFAFQPRMTAVLATELPGLLWDNTFPSSLLCRSRNSFPSREVDFSDLIVRLRVLSCETSPLFLVYLLEGRSASVELPIFSTYLIG